MGVGLAGLAVGCPARVPYSNVARQGSASVHFLRKDFEAALGLYHAYVPVIVPDGDSGGVIAPVLQFGETLQKDWGGVTVAVISYYATHNYLLIMASRSGPTEMIVTGQPVCSSIYFT